MIVVLTTPAGRHTIDAYLAYGGASVRDLLTVWTYPRALRELARAPEALPAGTWIFTDVDRLGEAGRARATALWDALQADRARWRTANHPALTLRRLALLEALHVAGINDFRAWRADGPLPDDVRFPVFVRVADDHGGSRSGLLADRPALVKDLSDRARAGRDLAGWIVCEHVDVRRADGSYLKYGAFVVDGVVVPRHAFVARDWVVKYGEDSTAPSRHAEWCYVHTNPHAALLADVCRRARVDYGRIDYGVGPDGRVRVWEINTNPQIVPPGVAAEPTRRSYTRHWQARFEAHLRALDGRVPSGRPTIGLLDRLRWRALVADEPGLGATDAERAVWRGARRAWSALARLRRSPQK